MTSIDDMMSHLDEARESNEEQVSEDSSSCANCQKSAENRNSIRKVSQSGESSGSNSGSRQTWTNLVCPNCGEVYDRKRSHS